MRDVWINMFGGNDNVRISVLGDHSFGNLSVLLGSGDDSFLVMGSSSTSPYVNSVISLSVDGGAGQDNIYVYKTRIGGGTIASADGNDAVYLNDVRANTLGLDLGNGNDAVYLNDVVANTLGLDLGNGNDAVYLNDVVANTLGLDLGNGNDRAFFSGNNKFGRYFPEYYGGLTVLGGGGRDVVYFGGRTVVQNKLTVDLGGGNDRLLVAAAASGSDPATIDVDGPDGQINTLIVAGSGHDVVRIGTGSGSGTSLSAQDQTKLSLGSGDDILFMRNAIFNLLIALLEEGNDKVVNDWGSSGVVVGAGSKLHGGPGVDVLASVWSAPTNLTVLAIP
jgi:hypothetical protein